MKPDLRLPIIGLLASFALQPVSLAQDKLEPIDPALSQKPGTPVPKAAPRDGEAAKASTQEKTEPIDPAVKRAQTGTPVPRPAPEKGVDGTPTPVQQNAGAADKGEKGPEPKIAITDVPEAPGKPDGAAGSEAEKAAVVRRQLRGVKRGYKLIEGPELAGPINRQAFPRGLFDEQKPESGKVSPGAPDLAYGAYQRGYYLSAFQLALPRAEAGDPAAQTLIAELYARGLGVARDESKAASWYRFAAQGGNREAQFAYANLIIQGKVFRLDKKQAREFMEKAAKAGHAKAQFNYAQMLVDERPTYAGFKKALPWYKAAAKAGLPDAQYAYANVLASGNGIPVPDFKEARIWLTRAAIGGFDTAQVELGIWLVNGKGGEAKPREAIAWFERAAARGNVIAQNRLARMHAFGVGTPKDGVKAGGWHILSKRAGYSDSELDQMFNGLSEIDKKRAIELANRARLPRR